MNEAFYLHAEVSCFSDFVNKLGQEILRNGIAWEPRFALKCQTCGNEMEETLDRCDVCGSLNLKEPSGLEQNKFKRIDLNNPPSFHGTSFFEQANDHGQTFQDVLKQYNDFLEIADNGFLYLKRKYLFNEGEQEITDSSPTGIYALDPREVEKLYDQETGELGWGKVCLAHRKTLHEDNKEDCPICGRVLFKAYYKLTRERLTSFHPQWEIFHTAKYHPGILYGTPKASFIRDDLWAYHHLEKQTAKYYQEGHPPGLLIFPTTNVESLKKLYAQIKEQRRQDPHEISWVGFQVSDGAGVKGVELIKMREDPNQEQLAVKDDLRMRIGAHFGISPVFQNDVSISGGLNNEGLQITVTNRAVEFGQSIYNEKLLPWLTKQFKIKDWVLKLEPSEEKDEMAEIERQSLQADIATKMWNMGFEVEYKDDEFKFSGVAKEKPDPNEMFGPLGGGQEEEVDGERNSGEPDEDVGNPLESVFKTKQSCPPGQHSHASYPYCHPENREHREEGGLEQKPSEGGRGKEPSEGKKPRAQGDEKYEKRESIEEVKEWFKSKGIKANVSKNTDLELANASCAEINEMLLRDHKVPSNIVFGSKDMKERQGVLGAFHVAASYNSRSNTIFINDRSQLFKDGLETTKKIQKRSYDDGLNSFEDPVGAIRHELAHCIHAQEHEKAFFHCQIRNFTEEQKETIADGVGSYAASDPNEFVAETYAALREGKRFVDHDQIMEWFNDFSGGMKV